jgi:hypothetical protein
MGVFEDTLDPKQVKECYDPHPGFDNGVFSFPEKVKEVAEKLNGEKMSIKEAVMKIMAVTKDEPGWKVQYSEDCVYLVISIRGRFDHEHTFCVIKFR